MWVTLGLVLFGLFLASRIENRLGAAFLAFSGVTILHVVLETGPQLLSGSILGRRVSVALRELDRHGGGSIPQMFAATLAGVILIDLLARVSDDRKPG